MTRSGTALAVLVLILTAPFSAEASPRDSYAATSNPGAVRPSSSATYTIQLANAGNSADRARQATIGVSSAFAVDPLSLSDTTTAAGTCSSATWTPTWDAVNSRINLTWPGGDANELCPGGTLTVRFQATASATEGIYTWTTQLLRDSASFTLRGSQPTVTVDGTAPPPPTITSAPANPSNSSSPSFAFSDTEAGVALQCQLDGGGFTACSSPQSYSGLADGPHTFDVEATDAAGNTSDKTSVAWTIDTLPPPAPTLDSTPPSLSNANGASVAFSDTEAGVHFQCQLDGSGFTACSSPQSYSGLADGAHTFQVRALDAAGNASSSTSYAWTIDTTPPTVALTATPADPSNDPTPSFSFSASETGTTFQCRLDGGAWVSCTSPVIYGPLGEGDHTFAVKATDAAKNTGPAATYSWSIDLTPPPSPTITASPANPSNSSSPSFAFSDTEAGVHFQCQLDGGGFTTCSSPQSYSGLAEGSHTFQIRALDAAGNVSSSASYSWTIDTAPPPTPVIDPDSVPPNVTDSTGATFVFSDAEASATFRCSLDGASFTACTSPTSYAGLLDGSHEFRVKARDAALNESAPASYTWTVDTVNPVVTIASGPADPTNQTQATFVFSSNKAGGTYECKLDAAAFGACTSPASYSGLSDGRHSFEVKATDAVGNTGLATIYEWTVDTVPPTPPAIETGPPAQTNVRTARFVFSDSEFGLAFGCRLDGSAFEACSSPVTYAGLADGSHTFAVRATDLASNTGAPASYTWTVDTVAPETTISSGPAQTTNSSSATFIFMSNEAGSSFTCSVEGGAFAPCISPQTYGSFAEGAHTFQVRATDPAGNSDPSPASYTWTVDLHGITDKTAPGNVSRLVKSVGYGRLTLSWRLPPDADFDHVVVLVGNDPRQTPATPIYEGAGASYVDAHFRNGFYYRYRVVSYDHAGNASTGATAVVRPSALITSPPAGARLLAPPTLAWVPIPKATYYNVQLYFGSRKILSTWPNKAKLGLRRRWHYRGRSYRLQKGQYTWYVWPGFGRRSRGNFGPLVGQSGFVFVGKG